MDCLELTSLFDEVPLFWGLKKSSNQWAVLVALFQERPQGWSMGLLIV